MAMLVLQFGPSILKEFSLSGQVIIVGRSPQCNVFIDNPAVSHQHAKVYPEGHDYYIEDLGSLNGTYLNGTRVTHSVLASGDTIAIGKHTLHFTKVQGEQVVTEATEASKSASGTWIDKLEGTMVLESKQRQNMLAKKAEADAKAEAEASAKAGPKSGPKSEPKGPAREAAPPKAPQKATPAPQAAAGQIGKLIVINGKTNEGEYLLTSQTCIIGKGPTANIRLTGWFAPKVAGIINKREDAYFLSPTAPKATVNGQPIAGRHEMQDGDMISLGGVEMQFVLVSE